MRVRASSLNYRDQMVLKGGGRGPTKLGVVLLSDGAGEVAAIGEGVSRAKIGDVLRRAPCKTDVCGPSGAAYELNLANKLSKSTDNKVINKVIHMKR